MRPLSIAFVAGATGYTGREVVRQLVARRVETIAHVRPDAREFGRVSRELTGDGATVDSTAWDATSFAATLSRLGPTLVFGLLGTTRARMRATRARDGLAESYDTVDYGLTALLLSACVACGSRPRFVYLSALGAGQPSTNPYYAARLRLESELRASGLPFVIGRPAFVTGPDRAEPRRVERAAAAVVDGLLGWAGRLGASRIRYRYGSMTARILAGGLVALGLDPTNTACVADADALRLASGFEVGSLPGSR